MWCSGAREVIDEGRWYDHRGPLKDKKFKGDR